MNNTLVYLKRLILIWLLGSVFSVGILVLQTYGLKYGEDIYFAWLWAGISLIPSYGLFLYLFFSSTEKIKLKENQFKVLSWIVLGYQILVLLSILLTGFFNPPIRILHLSYIWLFPLQLFILSSLGLTLLKKESKEIIITDPKLKKIYFSYAWGDKNEKELSREDIVDRLYYSLKNDGFNVIRDKVNLNYGGSINQFMGEIGKGNLVLVFISEKYFKSHFCMFELNEIARNSKFDKNIFSDKVLPIPVEYLDFTKPKVLDEYLAYWEKEQNEWSKLVTNRVHQISITQYQRFEKTNLILQNFGKLSDWLADLNQMTTPLLSQNNFELIKTTILSRLQSINTNQ